jgi:hypothetical protein
MVKMLLLRKVETSTSKLARLKTSLATATEVLVRGAKMKAESRDLSRSHGPRPVARLTSPRENAIRAKSMPM